MTGLLAGIGVSVVEHPVLLAVIDVLLLLAAPVLEYIAVVRLRAPRSGQT